MQSRLTRVGLVAALSAATALADFRYDQTSRMTGGAMMAMMQMAARFNKNAMAPTNSTVAIKGHQMVMNHGKTATVIDLDKETFTEVNFEKREYSVTTFAEMKAFMEKSVLKTGSTESSLEVDVKETGKEDTINGMKAKEYLLSMKFEATNPQNGQKGEMQVEVSSWMSEKLPGYEEVTDFQKRMAEKMDMAGFMGGAQAGIGKGMAAAAKKLASMEGVPVLQITRMVPTDPQQVQAMEQAAQQQAASGQAPQTPNAGDVAGQAAGQAAAGAVANRMGRFGGLGAQGLGGLGGLRKKKQQEEPPPPPPPPAVTEAAPSGVKGSFASEASLMEMTVESKNFSNSGVEDGMFVVPSGFKSVKSAMQK